MPIKDAEARKAYDKLKYERNKEKIKQRMREYHAKHREEILPKLRQYQNKHRSERNAYVRDWRQNKQTQESRKQSLEAAREWRKKQGEAYREKQRQWKRDAYRRHREKILERTKSYHESNPDIPKKSQQAYRAKKENSPKIIARRMLNLAVKSGIIFRPKNCSKCGKVCRPHGHHPDYSKVLEVIWLCSSCHGEIHSSPV